MSTRIQIRRDTASNFTTVNPILASGEPALETDTRKQKIGDGVTAWNDLEYTEKEIQDIKNKYILGDDFYDISTESVFFDVTKWTPQNNGGTTPIFDNLSNFHKYGNLSLRFGDTTDGATTTFGKRLIMSAPIDLSEQDVFNFWVYVDGKLSVNLKDSSFYGQILFVVGDLNFVNSKGTNIFGTGGGSFNEGWNNISLNKADFSTNISGNFDWKAAQSFQFRVTKFQESIGSLFHFDSVFFGGKNDYKTPVCITLDDSHKDSYIMTKIMNKYGIPTSLFVITEYIDDHSTYPNYMTLDQVKHLYNQGNHIGFHHHILNGFSVDPTIMDSAIDWVYSNGFTREDGHLYGSYPNGAYSNACIDYAKNKGVKSLRSLTGLSRDDSYNREATKGLIEYESIANGGIADNFRVTSSKPTNVTEFLEMLTIAKNKKAAYLTYHHLTTEFTNIQEWETLAQELKTQIDSGEIECITYPNFINKYSN